MLQKIINLINPDNIDLDKLSGEELLALLANLNRYLRCLDESASVMDEDMLVDNLVSPTKEVQISALEYLSHNLGKIEDKKARATIVYYMVLNLHMFSDGNGRTARFMYDFISGDLSDENIPYYFHKDSNKTAEQKNALEISRGIADISEVNKIPDSFIGKQFDFIPPEILKNYLWITVGYSNSSPTTESIIPKHVFEQLSPKEKQDLNKILRDGYGMYLCPSGLAMLYVSNKKGELHNWIHKNQSDLAQGIGTNGRLNFSIYRNPDMIANWDVHDFRKIIEVGNKVKYARLKCLIDVFVEPEKYINSTTGNTYLLDIVGTSKSEEPKKMG